MNTLFAFVVLLSVLIFVHELGHFLVARACGVRVLKFSLGFGPPIGFGKHRLYWKRGHTEYVVAWFPLGGFVKMLGENTEDHDDSDVIANPEETLGAKRTWQKLAIVLAGPAMNLLLPIVVFVGTLAVGYPRPEPVVGMIEPDSPAAAAQLLPGDRIRAIDGEPIEWWDQFAEIVRARPEETLRVAFERDGEPRTTALHVGERTGLDEFQKRTSYGWTGIGHPRLLPKLGIPKETSPAHLAGLRSGDLVTAVDGQPVESWDELKSRYARATGETIALAITRGSLEEPETLEIAVPRVAGLEALGTVPANALVSFVEPDSPAQRAGLEPGDLILEVDGEGIGSFSGFAETVLTSEGRPLALLLARAGKLERITVSPELLPTDVGLGIEEPRYRVGISAPAAIARGVMATDRERNPLVAVPRAVGMTVDLTRRFLDGLGKIVTGEVSRKQIAGPIGIAEIAGKAFERGWEVYLQIMVLISINLGILNLLPIPILDGGQALLFTIEGIKRSPLSLRTREIVQHIGLTMLLLLMGFAFWNDISRNWSRVVDWLSQ